MSTATVTTKGQVTIPKDVRDKLNLAPGSRIEFQVEGECAIIRPANLDILELKGILHAKSKGKVVSLEEMEAAIVQGALDSSR